MKDASKARDKTKKNTVNKQWASFFWRSSFVTRDVESRLVREERGIYTFRGASRGKYLHRTSCRPCAPDGRHEKGG